MTERRLREIKAILSCPRCPACREHHLPEGVCPPSEVRTTGYYWLREQADAVPELEQIATELLAEVLRYREARP